MLSQNWRGVSQGEVAGWSSSSGVIEIWQSGFLGAVAPSGAQLSELQANDNSPSWQDIATLPGDRIGWSFYHRGRTNDDTVVVRMGDVSSPETQATITTGTADFVRYDGLFVVPDGQTLTRFMLDPQDSGSVGNLVDAVALTLECEVSVTSSVASTSDADGSGDLSVGDTIVFSYEVANTGSATLSVDVTEGLGDSVVCPNELLAPDSSMVCLSTHVVTQSDVDTGSVSSDAQAIGTDAEGVQVSDSDAAVVDIEQRPSLAFQKTGSLDMTVVAPSSRVDAGDVINYEFEVANTGNVTLESIAVVDALAAGSCPETSLPPSATMTCSAAYAVIQSDIDAAGVDNSATVTAESPTGTEVTAEDAVSTGLETQPSLAVAKSAGASSFASPGEQVVYEIVVTNTGNASLSDVRVSDASADKRSLACDMEPPVALLPGGMVNCTAVRTATQSDIDHGMISNTATAAGQDPAGSAVVGQDTVTVNAKQAPSITIVKTAAIDDAVVLPTDRTDAGDLVTYTITVTNTGNVTLDDVDVSDPVINDLNCDATSAAPGSSIVCTGSAAIEQADIDAGEITNTAVVAAMAPSGDIIEASTEIATPIEQAADVTLAKSASTASNGDGSFTFVYTIDVANPGNVTLTGLQIEDDLKKAFGDLGPSVISLTGDGLTVNDAYDGVTDMSLLDGGDRLPPGVQANVHLVVLVATDGHPGPFINEASVVASQGEATVADTNEAVSTVDVSFDLSVDVVAPMSAGPDEEVAWTTVVTNHGPSMAPGPVMVTSVIETGHTLVSATGPGWVCSAAGSTVTCVSEGDLVASSSTAITLRTVVTAERGSTISMDATVAAADSANEATTANNTDAASVVVDALPMTGVDAIVLGQIAALLIAVGLVLLVMVGRRESNRSIATA